jgi:hypothetical protein
VFLGGVPGDTANPSAGTPETPPVEADPDPGIPVAPAPTPALIDRVIEAFLPADLPLAGVLPFDAAAAGEGAEALFARLGDLGVDVGDDWSSPERWAWLSAAVLVVGGVTYTVRAHRGRRRAEYVVLGTASALARWEGRHADGSSA